MAINNTLSPGLVTRNTSKRKGNEVSGAFVRRSKRPITGNEVSGAFATRENNSTGSNNSLSTKSDTSQGLVPLTSSKKTQSSSAPASLGSYKGVTIRPGSDADIQSQIRTIDESLSPIATPKKQEAMREKKEKQVTTPESTKGLLTFPGLASRIVESSAPNRTQTDILQDLRGTADKNREIAQDARRLSEQYGSEIARVGQLGAGAVAGHLSTGTNVVGSGNAAIASQSASARMNALAAGQQAALEGTGQQLTAEQQAANAQASALGGANTQQSQQLGGLGTAAGLVQPVQLPYNNQFIDPLTGQPIGGGASGGSLNTAVQTIVQRVQSGQMGYDEAAAALSGYGQGGVNALNQALGQNFDVVGSNARAAARTASTVQTGTTGGQLEKAAETVKEHMVTLLDSYNKLGAQFGIPLLNRGINAIASQFGSGPLQSYKIALSNVRDELAKILGGGTPTEGTRTTAQQILPDNMTPAQIESAIKTATELMNSKIQEYTRIPGIPGGAGGSGGNNIFAEEW